MMKPTYVIAIAAIILAASFAGIAVMGDDADAVGVDEVSAVAYTDGTYSNSEVLGEDAVSITIKAVADPFETEGFEYWVSASGIRYYADSTVAIATIAAEDIVNGVFTLTAHYASTTVDFEVDGKVTSIEPVVDQFAFPYAEKDPVKEGFQFLGWKYNGEAKDDEGTLYTSEDIATDGIVTLDGVKAGDVFTAVFAEVYEVKWVADGMTVGTGTSLAPSMPASPVGEKEHYTLLGWYDAAGVKYDEKYVFTADVTFTAKYDAERFTVTYMVGEEVYDTVEVKYNETAPRLAIEDYEWDFDFATLITADTTINAIKSDAPVIDETVNVTFKIEGKDPYTYPVSDRLQVPSTVREGYNFLGWTIEGTDAAMMTTEKVQSDIRTGVYTEDTVFVAVYEIAEPPAPEEPAFYETTTGQVAIVFIVFIVLLFGYGVYSNAFGLKDKLFGYKITKKSKEDKKE